MGSCSTLAFVSLAFFAFQACYLYEMSDGSTFQFNRRHFESLRIQKRSHEATSTEQLQCCGTFNEPSDREKAVQKECSHFLSCALSTKSNAKAVTEIIVCFAACMFTKLELVENGKVRLEMAKEFFRRYKEQEVNELSGKITDHCLKGAEQHFKDKSSTCNPIPLVLGDCQSKLLVMHCPKKYAVQSKKCEELRKELEEEQKKAKEQ